MVVCMRLVFLSSHGKESETTNLVEPDEVFNCRALGVVPSALHSQGFTSTENGLVVLMYCRLRWASSTEKPPAQRLFASALPTPSSSSVTTPLRFQVKELPSALHSEQISAHASASGFAMQFSVAILLELNDSMLRASSSSAIPVVPLKNKTARPKRVPLARRSRSPLRLSFHAS